jgi:hypothetical protein
MLRAALQTAKVAALGVLAAKVAQATAKAIEAAERRLKERKL